MTQGKCAVAPMRRGGRDSNAEMMASSDLHGLNSLQPHEETIRINSKYNSFSFKVETRATSFPLHLSDASGPCGCSTHHIWVIGENKSFVI